MKWHHVGLQVKDLETAVHFYREVFGFLVERRLNLAGEKIVFLRNGELRIELIQSGEIGEPNMHTAWSVDQINPWLKKLERVGLRPTEGPIELPGGGRTVFYEGPNGEMIELVEWF